MKQDNDDIFNESWADHILEAFMVGLLVATAFIWLPFYALGYVALKVKAIASKQSGGAI